MTAYRYIEWLKLRENKRYTHNWDGMNVM